MTIKYNVAQIRALMGLYEKGRLTKSQLFRSQWRTAVEIRNDWLTQLKREGLLLSEKRPRPNVNKTPEVFFLTEKGIAWVKAYLKEEGIEDIKPE